MNLSSARLPKRRRFTSFALAILFFAVLPMQGTSGCASRQACFTFSQEEFTTLGCPAQKDALPNFSDPRCPGEIISVDSEGEFDGEVCCYTVTYADIVPDCGNNIGSGGAGGGFSSGVVGGSFSSTIAVGAGGGQTCFSCADALLGVNEDPNLFCSDAFNPWQSLSGCACDPNKCADNCGDSFCVQVAPTSACFACLKQSCAPQVDDCTFH